MRASNACLRIVRRLANEVISSAEKAAAIAPGSSVAKAYYEELPSQLKQFFERYPPAPFAKYSDSPTMTNAPDANPFLANKNPVTNRWHKPKYSMRRQADLWKAAYRFGIEGLLPRLLHGRVFYEARYESKEMMRGARVFKLTKRERTAPARAAKLEKGLASIDDNLIKIKGKRMEKAIAARKENLTVRVDADSAAAKSIASAGAEAAKEFELVTVENTSSQPAGTDSKP